MPEPIATPATDQPPGACPGSARSIFWFAALAGVLLILLHNSLFTGNGLVPADGILIGPPWNQATRPSNFLLIDQFCVFLPMQEFVHQQRGFPLWNPNLCCGVPNLGAIAGAPLFRFDGCFRGLIPFLPAAPALF